MIFVNDLGRAAPAWMHHIRPPNADGMTLADVVFPAFLFIVGVSIPLAFERAGRDGKTWAQLGHILARTAGLLHGRDRLNSEDGETLGQPLWSVLAFTALILSWCAVPRERGRKRNYYGVKVVGIVGPAGLAGALSARARVGRIALRVRVEEWAWLRSEWWESSA